MERIPVESSNLKSVGYNKNNSTLEIAFHSGRIYQYYDVPQYEYQQLMNAPSHGTYANENIYDDYEQQRIAWNIGVFNFFGRIYTFSL